MGGENECEHCLALWTHYRRRPPAPPSKASLAPFLLPPARCSSSCQATSISHSSPILVLPLCCPRLEGRVGGECSVEAKLRAPHAPEGCCCCGGEGSQSSDSCSVPVPTAEKSSTCGEVEIELDLCEKYNLRQKMSRTPLSLAPVPPPWPWPDHPFPFSFRLAVRDLSNPSKFFRPSEPTIPSRLASMNTTSAP